MKSWLKFFLCIVAIFVFVQVLPVLLNRIPFYKNIHEKSEQLGIDNSSLFYTDEPITSDAEQKILEKLRTKENY